MITLNNKNIKKLQRDLNNEKIIFWKDITDLYFDKKTVIFLYNDLQSLSIHTKVMTNDGWLYDKTQDNIIIFIDKKNKKEVPFFIAEFKKNI